MLNAKRLAMAKEERCSVRLLVFGASMREESMNTTLASLAATVVEETTRVELGETAAV